MQEDVSDPVDDYLNHIRGYKDEVSELILNTRDNLFRIKEVLYESDESQELANKAASYDELFMMWFQEAFKFLYSGDRDAGLLGDSIQLGGQVEVMKLIKDIGIFNEDQLQTLEDSFKK